MVLSSPDLKNALSIQLLSMADDELILGHRDSEWCGHAPILEEDIAFANIALDELGHAMLWYARLAEISGENPDTYPDRLVFDRPSAEFRNVQLVELPRGDWAHTVVRQYLFDMYEFFVLEGLGKSAFRPVAEVAVKISKEEYYHRRHMEAWVRRLGLGTAESQRRMQAALKDLWSHAQQLFVPLPGEDLLSAADIVPSRDGLKESWLSAVIPLLEESGLVVPSGVEGRIPTRQEHSRHLQTLLEEMQSVTKSAPQASW